MIINPLSNATLFPLSLELTFNNLRTNLLLLFLHGPFLPLHHQLILRCQDRFRCFLVHLNRIHSQSLGFILNLLVVNHLRHRSEFPHYLHRFPSRNLAGSLFKSRLRICNHTRKNHKTQQNSSQLDQIFVELRNSSM